MYNWEAEPGDSCRDQQKVCFTPINIKGFRSWRRSHEFLKRSKESMIKANLSITTRPYRRNVWNLCLQCELIFFSSSRLGNINLLWLFFKGKAEWDFHHYHSWANFIFVLFFCVIVKLLIHIQISHFISITSSSWIYAGICWHYQQISNMSFCVIAS